MSEEVSNTCIDGRRYTLFDESTSYEAAKEICANNNLTIAITKTALQMQLVNDNFPDVWIGIEGNQTVIGVPNIESFRHADNTPLDPLFQIIGDFPWRSGQPNNSEGNDNCVASVQRDRFFDVDCLDEKRVLCSELCESPISEYSHFRIQSTQEQAVAFCNDRNLTLATIDSFSSFVQAVETITNGSPTFAGVNAWVGLVGDQPIPGEPNIGSFQSIDGNRDRSFFQTPNTFPWIDDQPNNIGGAVGELQNCVVLDVGFTKSVGYSDKACSDTKNILCSPLRSFENVENDESILYSTLVLAFIIISLLLVLISKQQKLKKVRELAVLQSYETSIS